MIEDYKENGLWVKEVKINGVRSKTISYLKWYSFMQRCMVEGSYQKMKPTYDGVTCSDTFRDFQKFTNWHVEQIGYGQKDYQLDKDILFPHMKLYGEDNCVLVPPIVNNFFSRVRHKTNNLPLGVYLQIPSGKYVSSIGKGGKRVHLGVFTTIEEASAKYLSARRDDAEELYNLYLNRKLFVDYRVANKLQEISLDKAY